MSYYNLGSDILSKLPSIFHTNDKFYTNNKSSFNTFDKIKEEVKKENDTSIDKDDLINYFNKRVVITLKDGSVYSGVLISKRDNKILLDSNAYILIDDISNIN